MDKDDVVKLLRQETETIENEIDKIEVKMSNLFNKTGINSLEKINKLQKERELLKSQSFKLYEMLGKIK